MRFRWRWAWLLPFLCCLCALVAPSSPVSTGATVSNTLFAADAGARLTSQIAALVRQNNLPSAAVGIFVPGTRILRPLRHHHGFSTDMYYVKQLDASLVISVNRLDRDNKSQSTAIFGLVGKTMLSTLARTESNAGRRSKPSSAPETRSIATTRTRKKKGERTI
jgi:hypothetical protein